MNTKLAKTGLITAWIITQACLAYAANLPPKVVSIVPSNSSSKANAAVNFVTTFSDPNGYQNIRYVYFLMNISLNGKNCFYGYYNRATNRLYLYNDTGTALLGGYAPGSATVIENTYARINCAQTTVTGSGTTLTIKWNVIFKTPFVGTANKYIYLYVRDASGAYNGWVQKGYWKVLPPNSPPLVGMIIPSSGSSQADAPVNFITSYSDPNGASDIRYVYLLINNTLRASSGLYALYFQGSNIIYLMNDAGTAWIGPYSPGSSNIMENSYVKIDCSKTTVSRSGNTLTINWSVVFKSSFAGLKNAYLYAQDNDSASSGWSQKGTWTINTVPADNPPIITANIISSVKGSAAGNALGSTVMSAKNINGNGSNGIIISAPGSSAGTDIGRVHVYFGDDITKSADLVLTGSFSGGCFGYSVAVGDINGDGYADIIIGEPYNGENGANSGKVFIYFGGLSPHTYPDVTLTGQTAGDLFGYSLACRDINNDSRDDIIIGAPYNSATGTNAGKVYIYFGGYSINSTSDVSLIGDTAEDLFGVSLASARNVDGNGRNGIIVGASGKPGNVDRNGKAYIYLGGSAISATPNLIMSGEVKGDLFGISVSAGDFNGDDCGDIIIGAEKNNNNAGKAYIYFGGKALTNTPKLTFAGESANDRFGHLVSCAGDINGDGYSDIIVVSPNNTNGTGKAYILFGGLFMDNIIDAAISGEGPGDNFGSSVSSAKDMDNDGIDEFIIGASNNSLNGALSGKAYLYKITCSSPPARIPEALLDETQAKACKYFYDQVLNTAAAYGLVKDTCYSDYSSIAATGFGLTSLCVMASRYGTSPYWTITPAQASARVSATLDTLINIQYNQIGQEYYYGKEGFFFHFIGPDGKRESSLNAEVSTIDTALLLAGVITAGRYFGGDIQTKADKIFAAVKWNYFLDPNDEQFYHGWNPDYGLIQQTWDRPSDETLLITLLAIASDPQNQDFLKAFYGYPRGKNSYASSSQTFYVYNSYSGSLFTYVFAHCWYDFKKAGPDIPQNIQGARFAVPVDWWENSKTAAQANRQFCIDNSAAYSSYSQNDWGLSACFRPDRTYFGMNGAPPREYIAPDGGEPANDGTVPPYGAISVLPLMKDMETQGLSTNIAYQALSHYYNDYYFRLWGPYGPRDSFNHLKKFSTMYTGINLGPIALMIENYRTGLIWNTFMADAKISQVTHNIFTDTVSPVINQFSVTDPASPTPGYTQSAAVSVSIDGYDAGGITKWMITETLAQPSVSDFALKGSSSKPTIYTITSTGNGLKRLYAWAMDNAKNISGLNANSQAEIYLDATAPVMGSVMVDGPYTASSSQLRAKWSGADGESGVIEYQYCITDGSTTGTVIRGWTSTGTVPEVTAAGLSLAQNHTYYFGVKARNGAGSWSAAQYSAGITFNSLIPDITGINPNDGTFGYAGISTPVSPVVNNPNGYTLQYQFTIKGTVKQAWTNSPIYNWSASQSDIGLADIKVEVKNQYGTNYRTSAIYVVQAPVKPPLS